MLLKGRRMTLSGFSLEVTLVHFPSSVSWDGDLGLQEKTDSCLTVTRTLVNSPAPELSGKSEFEDTAKQGQSSYLF